jgi:hypothetical protein
MGYPIYARIGHLDVDIRNTDGIGGGELVGWLPIVGRNFRHPYLVTELIGIYFSKFRCQKMKLRRVKRNTWILNA